MSGSHRALDPLPVNSTGRKSKASGHLKSQSSKARLAPRFPIWGYDHELPCFGVWVMELRQCPSSSQAQARAVPLRRLHQALRHA